MRWQLEGYGPKPGEWLNFSRPIPRRLYPLLCEVAGLRYAEPLDEHNIGETHLSKAAADRIAAALGVCLPARHDWFVSPIAD